MSAKAEAKAAAALRELGATLKASATAPKLKTLQLFKDLGLDEEEDELELNIMEEIASLVKNADGPAGDQVKYEHAVGSMVKRWKLFVALYDLGEQEPTHEMVKLFVGFMYTYRQRTSKTGRQGLGDSMTPGGAGTHTGHTGARGRTRAHGTHRRTSQPSIQTQRHTRKKSTGGEPGL